MSFRIQKQVARYLVKKKSASKIIKQLTPFVISEKNAKRAIFRVDFKTKQTNEKPTLWRKRIKWEETH